MTRNQIVNQLKGVFAPAVTPFNRKGDVDLGLYRENVQRYAGIGLSGVVVAGSTGEAPFLSEAERLQLLDVAKSCARPRSSLPARGSKARC